MSRDESADQLLRSGAVPRQPSWVRRHLSKDRVRRTTLLVGHPHEIAALHRQLLQQPQQDYRVIGCCLSAPGPVVAPLPGLPVLGSRHDVVDVVRRYVVDTVAVLAPTGWDGAALRRLESDLEPTRADLVLATAAIGPAGSRVAGPDGGLRSPPRSGRPARRGVHGMGKASFDRAVAAVLLVVLAPVLLGVALCVKATSRGPVLVRLPRVGRDGRLFHLLKFRTTETGTESGGHPVADRSGDGRTEIASGETSLGAALRRYSIDELPQFVNVLKGDMSIVGPRPDPPSGTTRRGADEHRRSPVKPGLTGLVQAGRRPGGSPAEDGCMAVTDYVENWSLLLDLTILRTALAAVLRGSRAP